MVEQVVKHNADIVCCGYNKVKNNRIIDRFELEENSIFSNKEAIKDLFSTHSIIAPMAWNKLYRKELFIQNNIEYPKGKLHEDELTTYKLIYYSNKIVTLKECLYNYRIRQNSIMVGGFNIKRLEFVNDLDDIEEFVKKNCPEMGDFARCNSVYKLYVLIHDCTALSGSNEIYDYIKCRLKEKYINIDNLSLKRKIQISLSIKLPYAIYKKYVWLETNIYNFLSIKNRLISKYIK